MTACPVDSPAGGDCRARLLQAACEVFAAEGYRVGVDRIAAQAGVAKQTLYNHFPSKADLFAEVIRQSTAEFMVALGEDGEPLRERLIRFAVRYRERLLSPAGLGLYRMLVAEAPRFPDLAATFYEAGPRHSAARLSPSPNTKRRSSRPSAKWPTCSPRNRRCWRRGAPRRRRRPACSRRWPAADRQRWPASQKSATVAFSYNHKVVR